MQVVITSVTVNVGYMKARRISVKGMRRFRKRYKYYAKRKLRDVWSFEESQTVESYHGIDVEQELKDALLKQYCGIK